MKNVLLIKLLLTTTIIHSQPVVQPVSSGDYWRIDEYNNRLPELANKSTFPTTIKFSNGYAAIQDLSANRLVKENEITWNLGTVENVSNFVVEWSRDLKTFERAGIVQLVRTEDDGRYVFKHLFNDEKLVYYRVGIVTAANTIVYTPAVQLLEEEQVTKIFPTVITGGTFYIQTGKAFEKMQVLNMGNQLVYEKGINGQTGTITVGLPSLPKGIYFVRMLSADYPQHVQKILVE